MEEGFERAATIATTILGKQITVFDLAIIMTAIKLSRITSSQTLDDNYIDGINYLAFAGQFSTAEEQVAVALDEDIAAIVDSVITKYFYAQNRHIRGIGENKQKSPDQLLKHLFLQFCL